MAKPVVVLGLIGSVLDAGVGPSRWDRWRPSVALCQHEDFIVDRFDLMCDPKYDAILKTVCDDIAATSPETTVHTHVLATPDAWDFEAVYAALHDFARGYKFKPDEFDYFVHITTGSHVAQICLFLLTEARYLPAKLIQSVPPSKRGTGAGMVSVVDLDLSRYDRLAARFDQEVRESTSFLKGGIATRSPAFNALIDQIEKVAVGSKAPILLTGPMGAGKSRLARRVYDLKKHRGQFAGKFVEVNCATLRGDGAMSALFGHARGAFTGAIADRPGLLRAADGGLLFLDEIAELGPDEQAMLLRATEERRFLPVGSDKEVASDFQLIAGTNCDLQRAVATGTFREDLLARINLWTFRLPALKDRRVDIEPNLDFELEQAAKTLGSHVTFNKEARQKFLDFALSPAAAWAGNFRDLNAAVTRMVTLSTGGRISVESVEAEIARLAHSWTPPANEVDDPLPMLLSDEQLEGLDNFDRVQLAEVVRVCRKSKTLSDAGRALFAASRARKGSSNDADRLRKYLARFELSWAALSSLGND